MESLKKHGDPLEEEIRPEAVRGAEVVGNNQPGSKGDGSVTPGRRRHSRRGYRAS